MSKSVRIGWLTAGAGVLLLIAATRLAPVWHPPLFDGVVIEDPYRYLEPPPGKPGSPTMVSDTLALDQGTSPAALLWNARDTAAGADDLGP